VLRASSKAVRDRGAPANLNEVEPMSQTSGRTLQGAQRADRRRLECPAWAPCPFLGLLLSQLAPCLGQPRTPSEAYPESLDPGSDGRTTGMVSDSESSDSP
jgi:hypothetical protein